MEAALLSPPAVMRQRHADPGKFLAISHDAGLTGAPIGLLAFLRWWREQFGRTLPSILRCPGPLAPSFQELGPCLILGNTWMHHTRAGRRLLHRLPLAIRQQRSAILNFVRRQAPSIVYANTLTHGTLLDILAPLGLPTVSHAHELEYWITRAGPENLRLVRQHTHHYIAAAEAVRQYLIHSVGLPAEQISVVHEHIARLPELPAPSTRNTERDRLGLPREALVIGGCGAEHWRKGRDLIPGLLQAIRRRLPGREVRFLWIGRPGSPEEERTLRYDLRQTGTQDAYVTTGEVGDPFPIYAALDAFALLSREDPFPLACLEAAAAGAPVVCFEGAGGMPEFTQQRCGLSVPYLDLDALATQLAWLDAHPNSARQIAALARRQVAAAHLPDRTGPRLLEILQRVARG
jgi:glycosyltransferase involved in cell wall biosynthesis